MKRQFLFTFLMAVGCITAAFSQSDDKANVLAVERSMAAAFGKHDVVTLNNLFSDDINSINASGEIINKQQLFKSAQTMNGFVLSDLQVKIKVNIAIVTGTAVVTGSDNGPYTNKLRFTNVLERKNNQWQIIAVQQTTIAQ